jgi:hypothetical protein
VRALLRDPVAPAARHLATAGAALAVGDLGDRDGLDAGREFDEAPIDRETLTNLGVDPEVGVGVGVTR